MLETKIVETFTVVPVRCLMNQRSTITANFGRLLLIVILLDSICD